MSVFFSQLIRNSVPMFHFLRFSSIAGSVGIVVTASLLVLLCRELVIPHSIRLSETTSQALAQTLLTSSQPELDDYLTSVQGVESRESIDRALSVRLLKLFEEVKRETSVVRIKLYNRRGIVVFSTDRRQIGDNQANNAGFVLAENGRVASDLIYRDTVNRFESETEHDNLMHTYVPVQASPNGPIRGVFEIYTDMNPLVSHNRQMMFAIVAGAGLILLGHFGVQIWAAWRARRLVGAQQRANRERTASLEMFAAELLSSVEAEKKLLAARLHDDLAQALSAIKVKVEHGVGRIDTATEGRASLASTVPALQSAIRQVQAYAAQLRPSSLDDFGLLPAIKWFCHEFERTHPAIRIEDELLIDADFAFGPLASVIYRVVESALTTVARYSDTDRISLSLRLADRSIVLAIDDTSLDASYAAANDRSIDPDPDARYVAMRERTVLSGGTFSATSNKEGGITLVSRWPL